MKLSDYIVARLFDFGVTDYFGYQGTMIAHFVDSVYQQPLVKNHVCRNEQGAAFAACGYASAGERLAVAYATSGPGAINLISGIANAYYDSIPVLFITGQLNTYEQRPDIPELRQAGFQETNIVEIVHSITKYAKKISAAEEIRFELEKAVHIAMSGRKGPVLLDIPMDLQRAEIEPVRMVPFEKPEEKTERNDSEIVQALYDHLSAAQRPVLLLGNGISRADTGVFLRFAEANGLPIVTSLPAKDRVPADHALCFGYLGGAYGHRYANMITDGKSDLIIAAGISLCTRQTGTNVKQFAPGAKLIRFDVDATELRRKVKEDELSYCISSGELANILRENEDHWTAWTFQRPEWLAFCKAYKEYAERFDKEREERYPNRVIALLNRITCEGDTIVCDVGQHMMWLAQSVYAKKDQRFLFSGGHGAMGYALPAAIGAAIARPDHTVFCVCGDGGLQMNLQELEWLKQESIKVIVIVLNNHSLGLITQQQDAYFGGLHAGSAKPDYSAPDFAAIAGAYGLKAFQMESISSFKEALAECQQDTASSVIEFKLAQGTVAVPKTKLGARIYNQEPLIPEERLMAFLSEKEGRA